MRSIPRAGTAVSLPVAERIETPRAIAPPKMLPGYKPNTRFGSPMNDRTRFSSRISWLLLTIKGSRANIWASFIQLSLPTSSSVPASWRAEATNFEVRAEKILKELDSLYADMHEFNRTKSKKLKP